MTEGKRHATRLQGLKVGYVPFTSAFTAPGDRRRFVHWARHRGVSFEIARPERPYDVVVLTQAADLSVWRRLPRDGTRLVYDITNAYLKVPPTDPKGLLRGTAKFLTRQSRRFEPSFRRSMERMCRRADAVVCCSEEQRADILPLCANVHIILDAHDLAVGMPKSDYAGHVPFRLVWEGLPENVVTFSEIAPVLQALAARHRITLEVVTRPTHYRWMGRFLKRDTRGVLARTVRIPTVLHPWEESRLTSLCTAADLAVIPIPLRDALYAGKPENKLILLWRMGMPVVTSATPAYERAMDQAGVAMACRTRDEWEAVLERCLGDESYRRDAATRGREFAEREHSEERVLSRWDAAILSALG
jgi:hypothetical protein